jgi:hypothetical protein
MALLQPNNVARVKTALANNERVSAILPQFIRAEIPGLLLVSLAERELDKSAKGDIVRHDEGKQATIQERTSAKARWLLRTQGLDAAGSRIAAARPEGFFALAGRTPEGESPQEISPEGVPPFYEEGQIQQRALAEAEARRAYDTARVDPVSGQPSLIVRRRIPRDVAVLIAACSREIAEAWVRHSRKQPDTEDNRNEAGSLDRLERDVADTIRQKILRLIDLSRFGIDPDVNLDGCRS